MPTSMEKPLDGAGLAVVNQIFNERLSQVGGSSGGINWAASPYTGMTYFSDDNTFCCVWMATEKSNSILRLVRGTLILHVKAETISSSQKLDIKLPEGFPALSFNTVSNDVPSVTGTGSAKLTMTGAGSKVTFQLNQDKAAIAKGLYIGCVVGTIVG